MPICSSIFRITFGSSMAAMIFIRPAHLMQVSTSMLNTLANNLAQGIFFFLSSSCCGSSV